MVEKHVNKFLEEVQKHSDKSIQNEINELRTKAVEILEAFIFKNLKLQNPRTYSLIFLNNSIPIELQSLHQVKCALVMLLNLIDDGEFLDLPNSREANSVIFYSKTEKIIRESFDVFEELFSNYPGQMDAIVKDLNRYSQILSEEGLSERLNKLGAGLEDEIEYLKNILEDVLTWDDFRLYYGNDAAVMIATLQRLIASKIAKRELLGVTGEIKKNLEDENYRLDIFSPNGFRLFDYLMKNHLTTGTGWQSDIAFFYRMMKEMEKNPFIHVTQKSFNLFLADKYPELEAMGKYKVWFDVDTVKRQQAYSAAKSAIGLK
ncbi:hypothetical protein P872_13870 [Rhodonellum psychrophilum GCM71 = DSM 17998]|uniref:Uncharacterized protein n=2 Tax=Rhodonellum TaxID=336827 RepID=U5BIT7_9BACT|nr:MULTISPECIES: hypothetical protein [Rhodonellum]ERM80315.1 hypothetical protein P872_13870 [Rhodonellum psychrophilum GCM71 = DSM 17998]SDZ58881.1 hypothetical protein SAMN05444412_1376 [Rhodonellum ikkaensis]